jgi:hypothetical protein
MASTRDTPGLRRPNTSNCRDPRSFPDALAGIAPSGCQTTALLGNFDRSGMMPTTVAGTPLTRSVEPISAALPPYRDSQIERPRITTGGAPGASSCD